MRTLREVTVAICATGLILAAIIGNADAGERKFRYHVSGSAVSSTIDTNGDNSRAAVTNLHGTSSLGEISLQSINESKRKLSDPTDPGSVVSCQLPNGDPGIEFETVQGRGVIRARNGDLIFTKTVSGTNCVNLTCFGPQGQLLEGCFFTTTVTADITGGTGKFANASGSFEAIGPGTVLLTGPTGTFFSLVLDAEGTKVTDSASASHAIRVHERRSALNPIVISYGAKTPAARDGQTPKFLECLQEILVRQKMGKRIVKYKNRVKGPGGRLAHLPHVRHGGV